MDDNHRRKCGDYELYLRTTRVAGIYLEPGGVGRAVGRGAASAGAAVGADGVAGVSVAGGGGAADADARCGEDQRNRRRGVESGAGAVVSGAADGDGDWGACGGGS